MKKGVLLLTLCFINVLAFSQRIRPNRYEVLPAKEAGSIIFVGNSITDDCEWGELFENSVVLGRGIDGDHSAGILARTGELIRHKPSKVFFAVGTNDIAGGVPVDTIVGNLEKILTIFEKESPETKIYIQSVLPVGPNPMFIHSSHNNKGVLKLNNELKQFCIREKLTYIDLHSHFLADDGINLNPELTNDDLHIVGKGYLLWKDLIMEYITE